MSDHWQKKKKKKKKKKTENSWPLEPTLADVVYLERRAWGLGSFPSHLCWKRGQIMVSIPYPQGCSPRGSLIFNEKSFPQGWALQHEACVAGRASCGCLLAAGWEGKASSLAAHRGRCADARTRSGHCKYCLASDSLASGTKPCSHVIFIALIFRKQRWYAK